MSRHTETGTKLLESYRAAKSLSADQRDRALQKLQARMRTGAAPQHQLDVPVPELPKPESALHGSAWKRITRVARVLIGVGLITWLGMDAETASPTSPAAHSGRSPFADRDQTRAPAVQSGDVVGSQRPGTSAESGAAAPGAGPVRAPSTPDRSALRLGAAGPQVAATSGSAPRPEDVDPASAAKSGERGKLHATGANAATSRRGGDAHRFDAARAADARSVPGLTSRPDATDVLASTKLPPGTSSSSARGGAASQALLSAAREDSAQDGEAAPARSRGQPLTAAARTDAAARAPEPRGQLQATARAEVASRAPAQREQQLKAAGLEQETALMEQAQAALRRGDAQRALALLAEHTWLFPKGHLSEARDVARIDALCKAGHTEQARARAKHFLATRAHSPFAARVRASCLDANANRPAP